jgi:hypothetical protein
MMAHTCLHTHSEIHHEKPEADHHAAQKPAEAHVFAAVHMWVHILQMHTVSAVVTPAPCPLVSVQHAMHTDYTK